jgi:hypothetical protein
MLPDHHENLAVQAGKILGQSLDLRWFEARGKMLAADQDDAWGSLRDNFEKGSQHRRLRRERGADGEIRAATPPLEVGRDQGSMIVHAKGKALFGVKKPAAPKALGIRRTEPLEGRAARPLEADMENERRAGVLPHR